MVTIYVTTLLQKLWNTWVLSNNLIFANVVGEIPKGNQLQTLNDPSIYAGNFQLYRDPLPNNCLSDDDPIQSSMRTDHDDRDEVEKKYGRIKFYFVIFSGYATGFWAVIGTLIFKRDWRLAYFRFIEDMKEQIID